MSADRYVEIQLVNFQKWEDKIIRLSPGISLFKGKSGAGKSTFCRAIHFCLFGGKKWRKITTKGTNSKKTYVRFTYFSPENSFTIIRERPSESISVDLINNNTTTNLIAASAQAWIYSVFGTEDSWLCSSYLIQDKPQFFLYESNTNKKELLRQITFGDSSGAVNPDYFLNSLSSSCASLKTQILGISGELKTRKFLVDDLINKNPDIYTYGAFTPEILNTTEEELRLLLDKKTSLEIKLHDNNIRLDLESLIQNLKLQENSFNIIEMEQKLKLMLNIKRINLLKTKINFFDERILSIDKEQLKRDEFLYNLYIKHGFDIKNGNISDFLKSKQDQNKKHKKFLVLNKENELINKENRSIKESNEILAKVYNIKLKQYNKTLEEIKEYESQETKIKEKREKINTTNFILFDANDNGSSEFARNIVSYCKIANNELTCPHCSKGVVYENLRLQKGCLFSDEMRNVNNQKLELSLLELERRIDREEFIEEEHKFSKISKPIVPEDIEEPIKTKYKELLPYVEVLPVGFDIFDVPSNKYSDVSILINSIPLIDIYNEWNNSEFKDLPYDENETINLQELISAHKDNMNKIHFKEEQLSNMQPIDTDLPNKIKLTVDNIQIISRKVEIGKRSIELISHNEAINVLNHKHYEMVSYIDKFTDLSKFITKVANSSIDDIIMSINDSLEIICNDLFETPISICIATTKELKNGNEQNTINLEIIYNGNKYDAEDLSGGELRRVYLALMLGFSRINKSPIVILDEALHSIDDSTKLISLEKIKEWTGGKFVIHICHTITDGHHDHTITF